jgi:phage gpG-like protein
MVGRIDPGGAAAARTDAISKQLDELVQITEDLRPIWPEVGQAFAERQRTIFATGSRGRWAPLAASTLMKKAKTSISPSTILVDSGLLRDAATNANPINAREQSAEFGVPAADPSRAYSQYHIKGNGVPQRNPLPKFTPIERRDLINIIRKRLQKALDA